MNRRISINDVAARSGVSKSTVSRVISDRGGSVSGRALAAVRKAIDELGYTRNTNAAGLRTQRTYMVLLLVPDMANPFWSEIARGVQDLLEGGQYSVVVGNTDWNARREEEYLQLAATGRFDGLIVNSVTDDLPRIASAGIPAVLIGERSTRSLLDTVGTDTYAAARTALDHLRSMGHRRIAVAVAESGGERFLSRRRKAYEDFLAAQGLARDPGLVFRLPLSAEGGVDLARRLLALPRWKQRVSALFCGNDLLAISAMNELRARGVEPGRDLSVLGMDDIPAAAVTFPALTTVRKPRYRIGRTAAQFLLDRIREPDRAVRKQLFPGELVVRESVARVES
jgi:DNA-binding LacI/PurR family transcriptional regulator